MERSRNVTGMDEKQVENRNENNRCKKGIGIISIKRKCNEIERNNRAACNRTDDIQNTVYDIEVEEDHSYMANGVIVHNCHHIPAQTFYNIATKKCNTFYRVGLSATPKRADGNELMFIAAIGEIIKTTSVKELIANGTLAKPKFKFILAPITDLGSGKNYAEAYKNQIVNNNERNKLVARIAINLIKEGRSTLVLVTQVNHGKMIQNIIPDSKLLYGTARKNESQSKLTKEREIILEEFKSGKVRCIIATSLLDEGADITGLEAIVLAAGGKSEVKLMQRIGRALRKAEGKKDPIIVDIFDQGKWLRDHSQERRMIIKDVFGE